LTGLNFSLKFSQAAPSQPSKIIGIARIENGDFLYGIADQTWLFFLKGLTAKELAIWLYYNKHTNSMQ
jgi:hypothetical protein